MAFAVAAVIIYLQGIRYGTAYMAKVEKAYNLKYILAGWNATLSLFSFIGMCKTVPVVFSILMEHSYESSVCSDGVSTWRNGASGAWVFFFVLSKIPELFDTMFIILRKKPLIFLHWYHHVTVLLFCWSAYATAAGSGLYFVAMNYSVHSIMYAYYCMQILQIVPKWFPTVIITVAQIAQMLIGTGVCASCWYYVLSGRECHNDIKNLIAGAIMYGSYLYLFCEFFVNRYFKPKKDKSARAVKKVD
eukprot:CAMPEP_0170379334 /NCGR_PEP_ID=MMETSP0117_2-20130122/13290_1 /TAXON_ID=400756 /ORGANISM="Durinskia baltica, Strain CSIRO CS-38" /LENGTH=245 /DNA_ID=CAMNT_0010634771 /DNA_START=160 /DNA_END=898 /DNA_ORIENTATION=+